MLEVIIPTKNCREDLKRCLESLWNQIEPVSVIVVDAHSVDGTRDVAKYGCRLYDEPPSEVKGSRRAVALNEGLRHSKAKYVAFLDADVEVPLGWSRDMMANMKRWESGLAELIPSDVPTPVAAITSGCVSTDTPQSIIMRLGSPNHARRFAEATRLTSVPGYNAVYLRSAIDEVGGFDEGIGGCEDWELNKRLQEKGYCLLGVPDSPVIHHERRTLKAYAKQMRGYGWSRGRLLRVKHIFTPVHAIPSLLLVLAIFIIWWGIGYIMGVLDG